MLAEACRIERFDDVLRTLKRKRCQQGVGSGRDRVEYGTYHGRTDSDNARLARAACTERVVGGRTELIHMRCNRWYDHRRGHEVVLQPGHKGLPVVVVSEIFVENAAESLGSRPSQLVPHACDRSKACPQSYPTSSHSHLDRSRLHAMDTVAAQAPKPTLGVEDSWRPTVSIGPRSFHATDCLALPSTPMPPRRSVRLPLRRHVEEDSGSVHGFGDELGSNCRRGGQSPRTSPIG